MISNFVVMILPCLFRMLECQPQGAAAGPSAFNALDALRGRNSLTATEVKSMLASAKPGTSYPALTSIPQTAFSCSSVKQAGFYADPDTQCQVYRRCEPGLAMSSYLCPVGTLFNQIALVCDYWYNVQCGKSSQFTDYSNPRLYSGPNVRILDGGDDQQQVLRNT